MHRSAVLLMVVALLIASVGCSSSATSPPPASSHEVYWGTCPTPLTTNAIEAAVYPLTNSSVPNVQIAGTLSPGTTGPSCPFAMTFDSQGRLFVLNTNTPSTVNVYTLPLTSASTPAFTLTLGATHNDAGMTFDSSGNLWVSQFDANSIFEFTGPFTTTATLAPAATLTSNLLSPVGLQFDPAGDLYVADRTSGTSNSITVFAHPVTNGESSSAILKGLTDASGLLFDAGGNLYASSTNVGITRYNAATLSVSLGNNANPDITDTTGLIGGYFPTQFGFDASGNLYVSDCGLTGQIYVFPTGSAAFSSSLAPTVSFADANITSGQCAGGIVVR